MARRFNYTGRRKILRGDVQIELTRASSGLAFDATVALEGYGFPGDAQVWVEAYRKAIRMHFPFGTTSVVHAPEGRLLSEFDSPDGVQFRIRVTAVGEEHGKLLGVADRIRPSDASESATHAPSLLGLASAPLHGRIWALHFEDDGPRLVLDESIEDRQVVAGSDAFASLVLPAAFREVLLRILVIEPEGWAQEDAEEWQEKWIDFAKRVPGAGELPDLVPGNPEERLDWIADCTAGFARHIESGKRFELMQKEGSA